MLVTDQGMVKVADFGTSRFLEIAAHGTTVIGSPPYMAPEQFQGKAVFASDIYSLGVTMYQMFTGVLPYNTPMPGDLEKLMRGELASPPKLKNPKLPKAISDIVMKAIAADIPSRYQRASDLLEAVLAARTPAPSSIKRPWRPAPVAGVVASEEVQDIQARLKARESRAGEVLLEMRQGAARPRRRLPLLLRTAVASVTRSGSKSRHDPHGIRGYRQDLDERIDGGLERRHHPRRVARHSLRHRRLRRPARLRFEKRHQRVPPRAAHAPHDRLVQGLPHGAEVVAGRAVDRPSSTPFASTASRAATSGRWSFAATTR